jgi:L-fuculose-phosphate aldolase
MMYHIRPETGGVVHTHSPYATTLAVMHLTIPAVHYEIAALAEDEVPLVPYTTYGTADLAEHCRGAIGSANAALLANHGTLAFGPTLETAATFSQMLEFLAMLYYRSRLAGEPVILPHEEILHVRERFRTHGQQRQVTSG